MPVDAGKNIQIDLKGKATKGRFLAVSVQLLIDEANMWEVEIIFFLGGRPPKNGNQPLMFHKKKGFQSRGEVEI